jgi:hypothetical protein
MPRCMENTTTLPRKARTARHTPRTSGARSSRARAKAWSAGRCCVPPRRQLPTRAAFGGTPRPPRASHQRWVGPAASDPRHTGSAPSQAGSSSRFAEDPHHACQDGRPAVRHRLPNATPPPPSGTPDRHRCQCCGNGNTAVRTTQAAGAAVPDRDVGTRSDPPRHHRRRAPPRRAGPREVASRDAVSTLIGYGWIGNVRATPRSESTTRRTVFARPTLPRPEPTTQRRVLHSCGQVWGTS